MYAIDIKYTREFLAGDTVGIGSGFLLSRTMARGTFPSTGRSRFLARPGPVPLQRPYVHHSCDVAAAYSGRRGPRGALHARDVPLPLFDSMLSETPGARQPLSTSVD